MAREFVMGARLLLTDAFSRPLRFIRDGLQRAQDGTNQYRDANGRLRDEMGRFTARARQTEAEMRQIGGAAESARGHLVSLHSAIMAVAGGVAVKKGFDWLVQGNADMETYQNTLAVVLKDQQKAADTLAWAATFAASTPFEIPEVVEATTKLASYGLEAKKVLGVTGDMAAVMGKSLDQAVEAIADAQTGELERLKEFGITKAMIEAQGAKMGATLTNKSGQITDEKAFNAALFALMEDRYKGGMELQSKTFKGMLSNASDFVGTMGRELGKPVFEKLKVGMGDVLEWAQRLKDSGQLQAWIVGVQNAAGTAWRVMAGAGAIIGQVFRESYRVARQNVEMIAGVMTAWYAEHKPQLEIIGQGFMAAFRALQDAWQQYAVPAITWLRGSNGLKGLVEGIAEVAGWIVDAAAYFVDNWGVIAPIIVGLGAAWGAYGLTVLAVTGYTKAAALATQGWAKAQLAWNAIMAVNPAYLIVTAIGLLIAAGILLWQNWDTVKAKAVELWEGTVAVAGRAVEAFSKTLIDFKDNAVQKVKDIFDDLTATYHKHETAIKVTAGILATLFGPALIKTGIQATIAGAQMAAGFIANLVRTGAVSLIVSGQIYASIVASMIRTGVQATISGAIMSAQFIASMIKASAQAVITGATITASLIAAMITSAAQAVVTAGRFTGTLIVSLVAYAAQGWRTATAIGAQTVALLANGAQAAASGIAWVALRTIQVVGTAVTWGMTAAQWALNAAFWANPITWVVALIVGLIAVGVLLWKNWDTIKAKTIEVWQTVQGWIMQAPDWLLAIIAPALLIVKHWDDIKNVAGVVWEAVQEAFGNMKAKVLEFGQQIMDTWASVKSFLKNPIKGTINLIQNGSVNPEATDGSHATGLRRVPFDGYTATLHRDEAVLTAAEARRYDTAMGFQQQAAPVVMPSQAAQAPVQDVLMRPTFQVPAPTVQNVTAAAAAPVVNIPAVGSPTFAPVIEAAANPAPAFSPTIQAPAAASPIVNPVVQAAVNPAPAFNPVINIPAAAAPTVSPIVQAAVQPAPAFSPVINAPATVSPIVSPVVQAAAQSAPVFNPVVQAASQPAPVFSPVVQAADRQRQIVFQAPAQEEARRFDQALQDQEPAQPNTQRFAGALGAKAQPAAAAAAPVYHIEKLVEKVEIQAAPGDDGEALYEKFINVFHRKAKEAASILSNAEMGALL
jgi:hypothetical protein